MRYQSDAMSVKGHRENTACFCNQLSSLFVVEPRNELWKAANFPILTILTNLINKIIACTNTMDSNGNLVTPIAIGLIAGSRQIPELHFEWDLKMTRKSDRNPNQETPLEFAKDEWVKFKPITRKVDLTPIERADFETAIYKSFDRLVSSWIRRFIPFNLLESNDAAQLHLEALNELIVTIWKILAVQDINANEATLICWTITNRRAIDSLRKEASLKRSIPGGLVELDAIGELADRNDSYSPDRVAELNDLKRVIVGSLQQIQQRVLAQPYLLRY